MTRTPIAILLAAALSSAPVQAQPAAPSSATTTSSQATAADRRAANALYKEGVRLFSAGAFADALELFEQAYHRYPDARILFSIASAQHQLGQFVVAANSYQRYLDDPKATAPLAKDSRAALQALDATLGRIEIAFQGEPGEIQVGDDIWRAVGTRLIRVAPGSFIVRGRHAADAGTFETTGKVLPGEVTPVVVVWTVPTQQPAPVRVDPPPQRDRADPPELSRANTTRYLAYGLGVAGLALGGTAAALELSSRSKISSARKVCSSLQCDEPEYGQATGLLDAARARRNLALLGGGLAVVAIGTGVVLLLRSQPDDSARRAAEARLRLIPAAERGGVGLLLGGTF
jgi:tetratricopeptide (TPR) repeat protein